MSRWMVNVRGQAFSAGNMDELMKLAKNGELGAGDIVQPPGADEWIYALEVPELKGSLRQDGSGEWEVAGAQSEGSPVIKWVAAAGLAAVAVGAWAYAWDLSQTIPQPEDLELIGGKSGLSFSEVLVTAENGKLYATASTSAAEVGPLPKNSKADLLAKRDDWYKLRVDGKEGYAKIDQVIPAYFFADDKTKLDYDPLYNPDQYVKVANSAWSIVEMAGNEVSVFNFMFSNDSKFAMTDLKLLATIKDESGAELEKREIAVEGNLLADSSAMVGMLRENKNAKEGGRIMTSTLYEEMLKTDPDLAERWVDGVEVKLASKGSSAAEIRLLEVRAIPPGEMPTPK